MRKIFVSSVICLGLIACTSPTWIKPGQSVQAGKEATWDCRVEASTALGLIVAPWSHLVRQCMEAHGWQEQLNN